MALIANFIRFPAVKKIENRLTFHKVRDSLKVGRFYETQCITQTRMSLNVGKRKLLDREINIQILYDSTDAVYISFNQSVNKKLTILSCTTHKSPTSTLTLTQTVTLIQMTLNVLAVTLMSISQYSRTDNIKTKTGFSFSSL